MLFGKLISPNTEQGSGTVRAFCDGSRWGLTAVVICLPSSIQRSSSHESKIGQGIGLGCGALVSGGCNEGVYDCLIATAVATARPLSVISKQVQTKYGSHELGGLSLPFTM